MKLKLNRPQIAGDHLMPAGSIVEIEPRKGQYLLDMGDAVKAGPSDKLTPEPAPLIKSNVNIGTDDLAAVVSAVRKADASPEAKAAGDRYKDTRSQAEIDAERQASENKIIDKGTEKMLNPPTEAELKASNAKSAAASDAELKAAADNRAALTKSNQENAAKLKDEADVKPGSASDTAKHV